MRRRSAFAGAIFTVQSIWIILLGVMGILALPHVKRENENLVMPILGNPETINSNYGNIRNFKPGSQAVWEAFLRTHQDSASNWTDGEVAKFIIDFGRSLTWKPGRTTPAMY